MNWIPRIFRRKLYDDLSEEIRLHIEERAEQLMAEGMAETKPNNKPVERSAIRHRSRSAAVKSGNGQPWSRSGPTRDSRYGSCASLPHSLSQQFSHSPWPLAQTRSSSV